MESRLLNSSVNFLISLFKHGSGHPVQQIFEPCTRPDIKNVWNPSTSKILRTLKLYILIYLRVNLRKKNIGTSLHQVLSRLISIIRLITLIQIYYSVVTHSGSAFVHVLGQAKTNGTFQGPGPLVTTTRCQCLLLQLLIFERCMQSTEFTSYHSKYGECRFKYDNAWALQIHYIKFFSKSSLFSPFSPYFKEV